MAVELSVMKDRESLVHFGPKYSTGARFYYTRDHLGSIREVRDASGTVVSRYRYDPYGVRTLVSGSDKSEFSFTGHYLHRTSGLLLAPYRAYSPSLGRWMSRDPIGEKGGLNLYGYVGNRAVGAVDPLGLTDLILVSPEDPLYGDLLGYNPSHFTVGAHGTSDFIQNHLSSPIVDLAPQELADMIRNHPVYKPGMKVELVACSTGAGSNSFAQHLADILQTVVIAPDRAITFNYSGKPAILHDGWLHLPLLRLPLPLPDLRGSFREFHPR